MKKLLFLLVFVSISILGFSQQIRLSGNIYDVFTKLPLSKAIITVNGSDNTLITDENGYFIVVLKESGVYDVEISKNGYKSLIETFILNESIGLQIMLTSNAGTPDPVLLAQETKSAGTTTSTPTKTTSTTSKQKTAKPSKQKPTKEPVMASKQSKNTTSKTIAQNTTAAKEVSTAQNTTKTEAAKQATANETAAKTTTTKEEAPKLASNNQAKTIEVKTPEVKVELETVTHVQISGEARDKVTKETLGDALISIKGIKNRFWTSEDGEFIISVPKQAEYFMTASKEGYESVTGNIPGTDDLVLDIFLTKIEDLIPLEFTTADVVISKTRATETTPTTFKKIAKEELAENNLGKDLPFLLELTPSVVATSDGGSGTGYTSMRVRGSDITRINFTLNGFPVNDAESQAVFLVNMPDLASSIDDIQIQRGIGTSTNGAGAFGASINMNTNNLKTKPFAEINNAYGSFNTLKNTVKLGTGTLFNHFSFDGRFSHVSTNGYIDRASAKLLSYALTANYFSKRSSIKFNVFNGIEKTYQAWNGVDYNTMQTNRTYNSAGTDYDQLATPYENETDNYNQQNYQLSFSHNFGRGFSANLGFHYTKGKGYFEQYKVNAKLSKYGINSTTKTDLVRRRWLDNDFYGAIFALNYKKEKIDVTLGGGWNQYDGDHFGEIIWAKDSREVSKDYVYYFNNSLKTDFNTFLKAEYKVLKRLILFADIQYRRVSYTADGKDNDQVAILENVDYNFINPKAGATVLLGKEMKSQLYASFAMANREPTRNDYIDNIDAPKPENMIDIELGFRHLGKKLSYGANAFYMKYKNQLVLTGELNDVGSAARANVDKSFRTGVEVEIAYEPIKYFGITGAGAWSLNEIESFSFKNYNGDIEVHDKTKIAYSPALVGNFTLYSKPFKGFEVALINKYVSEQFLDNTNSKSKILNPYFLNDARLSYVLNPKFMKQIEFIFKVNNILNVKYASNGFVYYDSPFFYPQAGTNFEGAINLKF